MTVGAALLLILAALVVLALAKTIRIIPQGRVAVVERLGKYHRQLDPGPSMLVPFIDRVRYTIDVREQVVSFPPQEVITQDNLTVNVDTVIYFQVVEAVSAVYEIANYISAVEQLTMTTLRNIVGGMDLEETLTSRDRINAALKRVLDETTGRWGIKVQRVEIKGIEPPVSIKDSMEKQMRADRDKRAAILKAQGEGKAIQTVFQAIHDGQPDQALLAYQYLQMMPKIAEGDANKVWVVPSEITKALEGLGSAVHEVSGIPQKTGGPRVRVDLDEVDELSEPRDESLASANEAVREAIAAAEESAAGTADPAATSSNIDAAIEN
ncbi:MAG: SPFH/Band 7/PHB domain protein, partial [Myxococcales bacterium]